MKFTATELSRNPNKVFRAAYDAKGEPITIVHGQYSEGFSLRLKEVPVTIPSYFDANDICPTIPLQFLPEMTDAQKDFIIRKMTHGVELTGAKLSFIDDLPGYAILSVNDIIKGPLFRCINYQMRNFLASTREECEAMARAHAGKDKGHE